MMINNNKIFKLIGKIRIQLIKTLNNNHKSHSGKMNKNSKIEKKKNYRMFAVLLIIKKMIFRYSYLIVNNQNNPILNKCIKHNRNQIKKIILKKKKQKKNSQIIYFKLSN